MATNMLVEPKELYIEISSSANWARVVPNLSRAVLENVCQYEMGVSSDKYDELPRVMRDGPDVSVPRVDDIPHHERPLLDQVRNRLATLLRDAEHQGRLSAFNDRLNELFADAPIDRSETTPAAFLDLARRLDKSGQTDAALDIVFDQIDEMLLAGKFKKVNQLLVDTETDNYSVELLLGILTATLPAKNQLQDRAEFYKRTARTLHSRGELQEGLLVGLD